MKTAKAITTIFSIVCMALHVHAQGSLTPPGIPAPTMKTLDQVEPRTPISSLPYSITSGGSYYLTTNLTAVGAGDGITVNADDVTIDLNGFTLRGSGGSSGHGINQLSSGSYLRVYNGRIVSWQGAGSYGIMAVNGSGNRFEDLDVSECDSGIRGGNNSKVARCHVHENYAQVEGYGIFSGAWSQVSDCIVAWTYSGGSSTGSAIRVEYASIVSGCTLLENQNTGIQVSSQCQVVENHCTLNGLSWSKPAIYASGNENRIVNNELLNNAVGIKVDGSGNQVAGNRVTGPYTDPYDFAPGNQLELILGQVPETLDWPCSVTFGGTLICSQTGGNGITVNSDDVTIDLAGHALIGPPGGSPGHGVFLAGAIRNVVVRNGIVRNFSDGVHAEYTQDSRFEHLIIATNGNCGVYLVGDGGQCDGNTIADCTISGNGNYGVYLSVFFGQCIGNTIADCTISGNSSSGVYLDGLYGQCNGNTLADCTISGNGGDGGVYLRGDVGQCAGNTIADCTIRKNANRGIYMYDADGNRVEGNHITGQTGSPSYGIYCEFTAKNLIFRNTCVGQTTNFTITASDTYGPIVTSTGALPTTGAGAHPLANFDY